MTAGYYHDGDIKTHIGGTEKKRKEKLTMPPIVTC
jgi:hypothetical protein